MIICPLCQQPLTRLEKQWLCANRHSFDIAKQGYVNLLPVQFKKSLNPGDTPEAVQARREFLGAGYYQPLCDAIKALVSTLQPHSMIDIGCGEGFYTSQLSALAAQVIAVDIAKPAIQIAAKRDPSVCWLVASAAKLPLQDGSVDLACSFFSPLPVDEMSRMLNAHGHVLMVTPAPGHLFAMREALFDQVQLHEPEKFIQHLAGRFELVQQQLLEYPLQLSQTALKQLIAMTPYAWKAKAERRQQLEAQDSFSTTASFQIYLFKKTGI